MKKFLMMAATVACMAAPAMAMDMMKGDTDKDGMISKAEWSAQSDSKFMMMDMNKDGMLDKDEMAAMHKKMGMMKKDGMMHKDGMMEKDGAMMKDDGAMMNK